MKKLLVLNTMILLILSSLVNAQNLNIEEKVIGIVMHESSPVLVTESNYLQLQKNDGDVWLKYYQKIYNDTTLRNPNLELKSESNLSIMPIIDFDYSAESLNQFNSEVLLKDIIVIDNTGNYIISSKGEELIAPFMSNSIRKSNK